jgi:aspartate racemase
MPNFNLPKIGIIGGAGPMAGLLLCQNIIQLCQKVYRCQEDSDFPYFMLLNYPFADMLKTERVSIRQTIQDQLSQCFNTFVSQGIQIGAIACNTLHAFLDVKMPLQIVHIIKEIERALKSKEIRQSLVLCSRTSAQNQLHQSFFDCQYPNYEFQVKVDALIDSILKGEEKIEDLTQLIDDIHSFCSWNFHRNDEPIAIVLGCTELSVLNVKYPLSVLGLDSRFVVIDSTHVLAEGLCQLIFNNK